MIFLAMAFTCMPLLLIRGRNTVAGFYVAQSSVRARGQLVGGCGEQGGSYPSVIILQIKDHVILDR
jgi:hypothetical protein